MRVEVGNDERVHLVAYGSDGAWKEAKLETGLQVMVPLFIANGDTIRVVTAGKKYLCKETSGE